MAVRWRKNDDDAKMDEERLKGELVSMNKSCKEKLDMEERVLVPKRAHITREGLEVVITRGDGERQAHAENSRRRIEEERHCEGGSSKKARERGERKERNRAQRKDRRMHKQQHQRQRQRQRQLQRVRAVAARHWNQVQAAVATQRECVRRGVGQMAREFPPQQSGAGLWSACS